jgi:sigma-B regulation protein RsbU (phosphoserine phosphatase)
VTFPGLPIGQLVLDKYLRITESDEVFTQLFGAVPVGMPLDDLVSERDRRGATALASQLNRFKPGMIVDLQLLIATPRRDRYVRLRLLAQGDGFRAFFEPADDPTSLTYELSLLRQRWSTVFNGSEDGIALLDEAGRLLEHNQRFLELLRLRSNHGILLSSDALLGRVLADLLPTELSPITAALLMNTGEINLTVTLGIDQLDVKGRTMRDPGSSRTETFLLVRDVTEQRQIEARDNIIRADLDRAAKFQRSILGRPPKIAGVQLGIVYEPLETVGGDVYDASLLPDGTLRLFIADATGHGIEAALSTILIKNEYDAIKKHGASPAASMRELNNRIASNHHNVEAMFSCVICDLDLARNKLRYSNAGHPAPLLVRNGDVESLEEDGALVGIKAGLRFPEWNMDLEAWESCVLVTDGVCESRDAAGKEFGIDRLCGAIREARRRNRDVCDEILAQVHEHRGIAPRRDDMTSLAVTRTSMTL